MALNLDKSEWKRVAFGDIVRNANETVRDPHGAGIDRIIAMEHLDPGELKISRWGSTDDGTTFTRRVKPGQTLFGKRRAYQRKVAYAEFDAICSGDIYTFEADETQLLGEYLPFLVQSNDFFDHALGTSAGSLSPRTNWRDLANFEFDLPPLAEQKRIADLLWAAERHKVAVRAACGSLDEARSAWRDSVFGSPVETARLDERAEVTLGRQRAPQHATGDHMRDYLRSANISGGRLLLDDIKQMNFTPVEQEKFRLVPGDVLVSEGTASPRELGSSAMWDPSDRETEMYFQKTLLRLRAREGLSTPVLLREWAQWAQESGAFIGVATGTGILHITGVRCAAMPFPVLTPTEAAEVEVRANQLGDAALRLELELKNLEALRTAVANELFGGN
jgi:type I restriction enzyme S subunit